MPEKPVGPSVPDRQKLASQPSENTGLLEAQNRPKNPSRFRFEKVNEVTWKLTNGELTDIPPSHGQSGVATERQKPSRR
jgi:hypothetical protein